MIASIFSLCFVTFYLSNILLVKSLVTLNQLYDLDYHISAITLDASDYVGINIGIPYQRGDHHQCTSVPVNYEFFPYGALEKVLSISVGGVYTDWEDWVCAFKEINLNWTSTNSSFNEQNNNCLEMKRRLKGTECDRDFRMHLEKSAAVKKLSTLRQWRRTVIQNIHKNIVLQNLLDKIKDIKENNPIGAHSDERLEMLGVYNTYVSFSLLSEIKSVSSSSIEFLKLVKKILEKNDIPISQYQFVMSVFEAIIVSEEIVNDTLDKYEYSTYKWMDYVTINDLLLQSIQEQGNWILNCSFPVEKKFTYYFTYIGIALKAFTFHTSVYEKIVYRNELRNCSIVNCILSTSGVSSEIERWIDQLVSSVTYFQMMNELSQCLQEVSNDILSTLSNLINQGYNQQNSTEIAFKFANCYSSMKNSMVEDIWLTFDYKTAKSGNVDPITTILSWNDTSHNFTLFSLVVNVSNIDDLFPVGPPGKNSGAIALQKIVNFFVQNVILPMKYVLFQDGAIPSSYNNVEHNYESSMVNEHNCLPGEYWSSLHEACETTPAGYWSNDGFLRECTNAISPNIVYTTRGETTPNCMFICLENRYRVENSCIIPPVGMYPVDGGFNIENCYNPNNAFIFLTSGNTGDKFSCRFTPRALATVALEQYFDPSKNFTLTIFIKFDKSLLESILDIDEKDSNEIGILSHAVLFTDYNFSFGFIFKKNETNFTYQQFVGVEEFSNIELSADSIKMEVDEEWHEYSLSYNENMHTFAFFRDRKYLGSQWFTYSNLNISTTNGTILTLGGFLLPNAIVNSPNCWFLPAEYSDIRLQQYLMVLNDEWTVNFQVNCQGDSYWGDYGCFSCSESGMELGGNDLHYAECQCSFGKYKMENGSCEWCPQWTAGSNGEVCFCIEGYVWDNEGKQCLQSKEAYPIPDHSWRFPASYSLQNSTQTIPKYSVIDLSAPDSIIQAAKEDTRLYCKITKGTNKIVINRYYKLEELPLSIRFLEPDQYTIYCYFKESLRMEGRAYTKFLNVKPILPRVQYFFPNYTTHYSPVALILLTSIDNSRIMYKLNVTKNDSEGWKVYDNSDPPLLIFSQNVSFYLQSQTDMYLDGPVTTVSWNIQIPREEFASEIQGSVTKDFSISVIIRFCENNPIIVLCIGFSVAILALCCGCICTCCTISTRLYCCIQKKKHSRRNQARISFSENDKLKSMRVSLPRNKKKYSRSDTRVINNIENMYRRSGMSQIGIGVVRPQPPEEILTRSERYKNSLRTSRRILQAKLNLDKELPFPQ